MVAENTGRRLETVERAFEIIEVLQETDGARVTELANQMDMAESTAHGYLTTLLHNGYLVKEGDEYSVGLKFLNLGGYAQQRKGEYKFAKKKTRELANETEERAQFIVEENGRGVYVHTETGSRAVRTDSRIGKLNYLHASAAGKAILAQSHQEKVETIIDRWGLPAVTENTITESESLYDELETVRTQGYSLNKEESTNGLRAVGVPIQRETGEVVGALSVSGPSNRLRGDIFKEELPELLLGVANELELKVQYE